VVVGEVFGRRDTTAALPRLCAAREELGLELAAGAIEAIRQAEGLPPDPDAERLRRAP
jgi:hypothetical protein